MTGSTDNIAWEHVVIAEIGLGCDAAQIASRYKRGACVSDSGCYSRYVRAMFLGRVAVEVGPGLEDLCNYDLVADKIALSVDNTYRGIDRITLRKSCEGWQRIVR